MRKTPRTGKSISIALALRACVRAKLRERDVSSVARVGWTDLWGGSRGPSEFQSQPFELQIGLLCFQKSGKAFIDVRLAVGLNVA